MSKTPFPLSLGPLSLCALGLLFVAPALAQDPATAPETGNASTAATAAAPGMITGVLGELTKLDGDHFEIRPWNPHLPRRIAGTLAPQAAVYRQRDAKQKDLQPGEMVMVAERVIKEIPSEARKKKQSLLQPEASGDAGDASAVVPALTVLRFWKVADSGPTAEEKVLARRVLLATAGFLPKAITAYADHSPSGLANAYDPYHHSKSYLGVVRSVAPLVIATATGEQAFKVSEDTVFVATEKMEPAELKKGQTVLVRSRTPASEEIDLDARVVVRCPPPKLTLADQRKMILRDEGKLDPKLQRR